MDAWLPLETLAFDGTRMRANNRRAGTRTPDRLREMKKELAVKFAELEAKVAAADAQEDEVFGEQSCHTLSDELVHTLRADIDYATAEAKTTYGILGVKVWIFKGEIIGQRDDPAGSNVQSFG